MILTVPVGKKKQDRFELRAEKAWLDRLEKQAKRFGLTTAAYIRRAVTKELETDEASDPDFRKQTEKE